MSKRRKVASDYMSQGKNKLYIFARENAEMAAFYFLRDRKDIELQGFVEDVPSAESLLDKPIFSKAAFLEEADPSRDAVFAPYVDGLARKQVFTDLKLAGYRVERYISPNASVWDANAIGENCFIKNTTTSSTALMLVMVAASGPATTLATTDRSRRLLPSRPTLCCLGVVVWVRVAILASTVRFGMD